MSAFSRPQSLFDLDVQRGNIGADSGIDTDPDADHPKQLEDEVIHLRTPADFNSARPQTAPVMPR